MNFFLPQNCTFWLLIGYYKITLVSERIGAVNINIWDKVFKNGPSKVCGRQSLKNLKGYIYM